MLLALILILFLFGCTQPIQTSSKVMCSTGGALKAHGIDFIGDNIALTCDCDGQQVLKSGENCLDCDYVVCEGTISYRCFLLVPSIDSFTKSEFPNGGILTNGFTERVQEKGMPIPCPPQ